MAQQTNQKLRTAIIGSAAGLLLAGAAQADISYSIKVSEKDFQNTAKVAALHQRIRRTAAKVCPSYFVSRGLTEVSQCRRDVEADLVSRIDHPELTSYVSGDSPALIASVEN